ncbi:MAG TPA: hypothetical protein VNL14_16170 [Candidatus Acidoferrales bacterium]|nr:hypothetical protein [Candidatus Acidoferrales bacterium]
MESLEQLKRKREATQAALQEKLSELEERVFATVTEAKNTMKRTVDVEHQVKTHPLGMIGASAALGFFLGRLLGFGGRRAASANRSRPERGLLANAIAGLLTSAMPAAASTLIVDWARNLSPWGKGSDRHRTEREKTNRR